MMNVEPSAGPPPLVLLVDPTVTSRQWMWRTLSRTFGILEAGDMRSARAWLTRRPDIDALVVKDELPDGRGGDLVRQLADTGRPIASRAIVMAAPGPEWSALVQAGATVIDPGDIRGTLSQLATWFFARDARVSRALLREVERSAGVAWH